MTTEQIEKLAKYIVYLYGRMNTYNAERNMDLVAWVSAKLEAVREITNIFDCRGEVYAKVEELRGWNYGNV